MQPIIFYSKESFFEIGFVILHLLMVDKERIIDSASFLVCILTLKKIIILTIKNLCSTSFLPILRIVFQVAPNV